MIKLFSACMISMLTLNIPKLAEARTNYPLIDCKTDKGEILKIIPSLGSGFVELIAPNGKTATAKTNYSFASDALDLRIEQDGQYAGGMRLFGYSTGCLDTPNGCVANAELPVFNYTDDAPIQCTRENSKIK